MAKENSLGSNGKSRLRWGYTTGTCAAAASKAALSYLLLGEPETRVTVRLPGEKTLSIQIAALESGQDQATAMVVKDAGDDPDCTHGAEIGARVRLVPGLWRSLEIRGGVGVGRVTRPGLAIPPGQWAINPIPRRMINWAVEDVLKEAPGILKNGQGVLVEVFVPKGEELSKETLNPRLGILGGISILGTTGLVKPFSHGAYRATIHTALKAARANGISKIFLVTGSTTDDFARALNPGVPEIAFCQMADYVKFTLEWVGRLGFEDCHIYSFFGKAVKMAQGLPQTHASQGEVDLGMVARVARETTGDLGLSNLIQRANTARHALHCLMGHPRGKDVVGAIGEMALFKLRAYNQERTNLVFTILDFDGKILWEGD